ncbi:hypothetical protein AMECASPLE_015291 [Ameca splendens]|uniref:Uncharacterized protein n=1 Tax=Ameca splendens TaxID=208324 RepID=A0ABV0XQT4_9TELE
MNLNLKNLTPACTFYICQYSWAFQNQYLSCVCTQSEQSCSSAEVKKDTARGWTHRGHIWADVDETITGISTMIPAFMHQLVNNCSFHTYKSQTHTHTHIHTKAFVRKNTMSLMHQRAYHQLVSHQKQDVWSLCLASFLAPLISIQMRTTSKLRCTVAAPVRNPVG